jgi:hypothetical protein
MLIKLEQFKKSLDSGETKSSLRERIRFTKNEQSRSVALRKIQSGTEKLERLLGGSTELFDERRRAARRIRVPSKRTRRHSEDLYNKLAPKWPRTAVCQTEHRTRLCLWNCCSADDPNCSDNSLNLVVSVPEASPRRSSWQESAFHVEER